MSDDPMVSRCTATSKQTGQRCRQRPIPGGTVCRFHGGAAPAVAAKAEQRQAEAAANESMAKLIPLVSTSDPIKDPIDLLARVVGMLEVATDKVGRRVDELQHLGAGQHLTQLRAEVVLWEKLLGHLRAGARDLAALGIAERQVELAAGQADIVVGAFRTALGVLGSQLLPDQRDLLLRAFLDALPGAPAGQLVVGEVAAS